MSAVSGSPLKILFLVHDYPPVGGGGVQRVLHLIRALDAAGHAVHLVAVDKDPGPFRDDSLLALHPARVPVTRYRLPSLQPVIERFKQARLSRLPGLVLPADLYVDASVFVGATTRAALEVARGFAPDVVIASGPPHGVIEAGRRVAAAVRATFVIDLRDPWIEPLVARFASPLAVAWSRTFQRRCLEAADSVVVTAPTLQTMLEGLPRSRPRRVTTITNGYDGDVPIDDDAMEKARALLRSPRGARTVAFIGRLFVSGGTGGSRRGALADRVFDALSSGREIVRGSDYHAGPWFQALTILADRRPDLHGRLETVFVGSVPEGQAAGFSRATEAFPVRYVGYQRLAVAAAAARVADGLALFNPSTTDDSPSFIIPGKMYEYIAAGPPIFTMCGPGDCADIIAQTGAGVWTHDRQPEPMADHLERWLDGHALPIHRDEQAITGYERAVLGRRFVEEVERAHAARRG